MSRAGILRQQPTPQHCLIVHHAGRSSMGVDLRPHDLLDECRQRAIFSHSLRQPLTHPTPDEIPEFVAAMLRASPV
jgi:hypothetical protein